MLWLTETVRDLGGRAEAVRRCRYGVIEIVDERLHAIHLRCWPAVATLFDSMILGRLQHRLGRGNRCLLYYNQPLGSSDFLALAYIVSSRETTLRTFRGALLVLDEIARLKNCDALVAEANNYRISPRLFRRWGWVRHLQGSRRRHYIKRFYGHYPLSGEAGAFSGCLSDQYAG